MNKKDTDQGKKPIMTVNHIRRSIDGFKDDRLIMLYKYALASNDVKLQRRVGERLGKIKK
jgi:hypothetical protein